MRAHINRFFLFYPSIPVVHNRSHPRLPRSACLPSSRDNRFKHNQFTGWSLENTMDDDPVDEFAIGVLAVVDYPIGQHHLDGLLSQCSSTYHGETNIHWARSLPCCLTQSTLKLWRSAFDITGGQCVRARVRVWFSWTAAHSVLCCANRFPFPHCVHPRRFYDEHIETSPALNIDDCVDNETKILAFSSESMK